MSSLVSMFGKRLIDLLGTTSVSDTDYVVIQKDTSGDQKTYKMLWSDFLDELQDDGARLVTIITVVDEHQLVATDSGRFLVFDDSSTATLNIPDGLVTGTNIAFTNVGSGSATINMLGSDTIRGAALLGDANGYGVATKITSTIWQLSERP